MADNHIIRVVVMIESGGGIEYQCPVRLLTDVFNAEQSKQIS